MERVRVGSRRDLLQTIVAMTLGLSTAGCNTLADDSTESSPERTTATGTAADDQAPSITEYRAEPQQDGTVLAVYMAGEDDRQLETARIAYGDRELSRQADGRSITIDDRLTDTAATSRDDGQVLYALTDTAGNETRKAVQPDDTAPELAFTARPTRQAGETALTIQAADDTGLSEVATLLEDNTLHHAEIHSTTYTDDRQVPLPDDQRFQQAPVTARARDWNDNTTEKDVATYVRKYDQVDDTRLDIGAVYISQQGGAFVQQCRDSYEGIEPAVGIYDETPIPTDITTNHIDQMTGHGLNRLVYDYGGFQTDENRIPALLDSLLIDQIELEPFYTKTNLLWQMDRDWRDTVLPEDLTYLRDTMLTRDNIATLDDRPVVSTWNFTYFLSESDANEKLLDEFGSYEAFVDDMRTHLAVDGTDPFLIAGKGPSMLQPGTELSGFVNHFDGITTWFPGGPWRDGGDMAWNDIIDRVERYFENNHRFATEHDMEFTPRVFPGYDERGTGCGRAGHKHFPRRPDRFRQLLDLAEQYATGDRIDIATWNDWAEGHQIEPGTFNGNTYGTDFVERVEEFQQGGAG